MIYIESKKKSLKKLRLVYNFAEIIDVTSKGSFPYVKLSPFYPHGDIPVPYSINHYSKSVEGIWQGLKVFEIEDVDTSKFEIEDMKGIKRTVRKFGNPLGHRKGVHSQELLDYHTARLLIYLPSYDWVLQNKTSEEVNMLINIAKTSDLVLLDYEVNCDLENTKKPLSHAGLIKRFIEKTHPDISTVIYSSPATKNKQKTKSFHKKDQLVKLGDGQLKMDF